MPRSPLPPDIDAFLRHPNPAVIASLRADGSPHTVVTWYIWDGQRILLSMDEGRVRLRYLRADPRVSLTVIDGDSWHRHVTLSGNVTNLDEDDGLGDIDRLARHYTGQPYGTRDRRRFSARIAIDAWHAWDGTHPWPAP